MSKANFRTNVLLKSIIGKDLITDDNIAILELVKNSFDANSKKVEIIFLNTIENNDSSLKRIPTADTSKIIIKDSGIGMNQSDLEDKWLNIAYSEKKNKQSEYGRLLAGNKGVGRFSCDKLGHFLDIYTKKVNDDYLHLHIDWERFEVDDQKYLDIQKIQLDINVIKKQAFKSKTGFDDFSHGTILQISKLREGWDIPKILALKRQLEKLINPNQAFKKNSFNIEIKAPEYLSSDKSRPEYEKINGAVKNKIFEKLNFRTSSIQANIDPSGSTITTTLTDRGNEIFRLVEKNNFSLLKDINVHVYYLNTYSKIYFTKQTGIRSVDFGSISLFINGFRIPPYGDAGDDWLGLEIRKGQGHSRYLGTREIVGRIEINDSENRYKIISSRTGVVNNPAFTQLTKDSSPFGFFYKSFRRLERFVAEGIKWDSAVEERGLEERVNLDSWKVSNEIYLEDDLSRNKRVLSLIYNIIDARKNEILELTLNESFILETVQKQTEKAKEELEKFAAEISSKKFSPQELGDFINKLAKQNLELNKFSTAIANYSSLPKREINSLEKLKQKYETTHTKLLEEKIELETRLKKEEEDRKQLEAQLESERKENLFNKKLAGTDIKEVVSLQHHIDRATEKINKNVSDLIEGINNDWGKPNLLKVVERISLENKKISSVVQFVTNANFNLKATAIKKDINRFIREYILEVHQEYEHLKLNRQLLNVNITGDKKPFIRSFRPIEIVMIIDNLFSNSFNAKSKNVEISLKTKSNSFELIFKDDGKNKIPDTNLARIYNMGFTTTHGAGIGLFHIKQLVEKMKGRIDVNNKLPRGTEFKILIPLHES
jgi:signal transduction histidine kinase